MSRQLFLSFHNHTKNVHNKLQMLSLISVRMTVSEKNLNVIPTRGRRADRMRDFKRTCVIHRQLECLKYLDTHSCLLRKKPPGCNNPKQKPGIKIKIVEINDLM